MSDIEYSQGIMTGAGAVVLKDGQPLTVDEIVSELNDLQAARTHPEQPSAEAVPEKIEIDKWDHTKTKIWQRGWNAAIDAMLASAPAVPGEPVFWWDGDLSDLDDCVRKEQSAYHTIPLYTHPHNGEQGGEWIRCDERLPTDESTVLAFVDDYSEPMVVPARYSANSEQWFDVECVDRDGDQNTLYQVILWTPMPSPPTEREG